MKAYLDLTKTGIIVFVLMSGLAGYAVSHPVGADIEFWRPICLLIGLYFLGAGSFALNQAQEWKIDQLMLRTQKRPIASGAIKPWQAYLLSALFIPFGLSLLLLLSWDTALLGVITILLYNVLYTLYWKKRWMFGAVPGAIPGALPVVIGYSANSTIYTAECMYLFLIMFLWQMPHFWCLAIRFKEDYKKGNIPVLPIHLGVDRTLYHIGLYVFIYAALALSSPWFLKANIFYIALVVPFTFKVIYEFIKFYRTNDEKKWLPFFLWVNLSVLVFLAVPVFDKWILYAQ